MAPSWQSLYNNCIYPALTYLDARVRKYDNNPPSVRTEYALVCFCDHAPYGDPIARTCLFTPKLLQFNEYAKDIRFEGGGYAHNAVTEGLYAAIELLGSCENKKAEKYILLATNSRNYDIPCRLPGQEGPQADIQDLLKQMQTDNIYLSCFLPHSLDPLKTHIKKLW